MNLDRVASLLAHGLTTAQVATIVGVTPARISQLKVEEEFQLLLSAKQAEAEAGNIEEESISAKYTAAEHALIKQVMELAPISEMRDTVAALRVVAERQEAAKKRMMPAQPQNPSTINVISISLPSHALPAPSIRLSSKGEVLEVGETTLAPLSSAAVTNLFAKMRDPAQSAELVGGNHEPETSNPSSEASSAKAVPAEEGFLEYARA